MFRVQKSERGNDYRGWAICVDGGIPVVDGEILVGWGVIPRSLHGRIDAMFGAIVTTESDLVFTGARRHSNSTAEMTTMIEALSYFGLYGFLARVEQSCIYDNSLHVVGFCLGMIGARTQIQLAFALRFTMQHVCSHGGNLGDECADHVAAFGAFSLASNRNVATRCQNFDAIACVDGCHNIREILERSQRIRTDVVSLSQHRN